MKITQRLHLRTIEHESHQGSSNGRDLQSKLPRDLIPKTSCSQFWNRKASGRDHKRGAGEISEVRAQKKAFSFIDGFHPAIHHNLRLDGRAFRLQHVDNLLRRAVTEQLSQFLLVICDPITPHERDEILRLVSSEGRFVET